MFKELLVSRAAILNGASKSPQKGAPGQGLPHDLKVSDLKVGEKTAF